jgi:DNA-binding NtrC family response regulator
LEQACKQSSFRFDLYYRLNVISITLPPLRAREGDVPVLAEAFLRRFMGARRGDHINMSPDEFGFDPAALKLLTRYHWPGNVRELQNTIERAAALAEGPIIRCEHLPERLHHYQPGESPATDPGSYKHAKQKIVKTFERSFLLELLKRHGGHMGRAAREAGVDRKTIERMVKRHGLRGLF